MQRRGNIEGGNRVTREKMEKVCFILNRFVGHNFYGGGGKVSYRLIKTLCRAGYIVDIICSGTTVDDYPGINKIIVIDKPYGKKPSELEAFFAEVRKHALREKYVAVISDHITPHADVSFVQYHTIEHRLRQHGITSIFRRLSKIERINKQREWARQSPRRFIAVSHAVKNDLITNLHVPPEKIGVVYPGVDIDEMSDGCSAPFRQLATPFTFGFVATGFSTKGGYVFFKAIQELARQGHQFKARIVYPEYNKKLWVRMLAKYYGLERYTEFIPYQQNVRDYYSSIQCLVMPSLHEAFGLVALEAMANNLPCIVSSVSGVSELIQDGVNGFVFDMRGKSHNNLNVKMSFVLNNNDVLRSIGQKGYETALEYTWDKTCADFVKEINLRT
jgi:glycosyltransferase involved in cell wall biosynthesis